MAADVRIEGGTIETEDDVLAVRGASSVELRLVSQTSFHEPDHGIRPDADEAEAWALVDRMTQALEARLDALAERSYDELRAEHVRDYQALFHAATLRLGPEEAEIEDRFAWALDEAS